MRNAGPIFLLLLDLTAGRPADKMWVGVKILKILYLGLYFVYYHCNAGAVLELHFSWRLSSIAYIKVCFEV